MSSSPPISSLNVPKGLVCISSQVSPAIGSCYSDQIIDSVIWDKLFDKATFGHSGHEKRKTRRKKKTKIGSK